MVVNGGSPWLFIWLIAGLLTSLQAQKLLCNQLDANQKLLDQMESCSPAIRIYAFQSGRGTFDLSNWNQTQFDNYFLNKAGTGRMDMIGNVIIKNSQLHSVDLVLADTSSGTTTYSFIIVKNDELKNLKISKTVNDTKLELEVRGNKQLKGSSIRKIKDVATKITHLQGPGECDIGGAPLPNIDVLESCRNIKEDLILDKNTKSSSQFSSILEGVQGCIKIENTQLENIRFLEDVVTSGCSKSHLIKNNGKLCKYDEILMKLRADKTFDISENKDCDHECTKEYVEKSLTPYDKCNIVVGKFELRGPVDLVKFNKKWAAVTELRGRIRIEDTDLTNISIFPNLKKIINNEPGEKAIHLLNNKKMTKFDLPSLVEIKMPSGSLEIPLAVDSHPPAFAFTWEERKKWENITSFTALRIPSLPESLPTIPTPLSTTPRPTTTLSPKAKEDKQKVEKLSRYALYTGIIGVSLFIIISSSGASILGYLFWYKPRKLEKRMTNAEEEKEKTLIEAASLSEIKSIKQVTVKQTLVTDIDDDDKTVNLKDEKINRDEEEIPEDLKEAYKKLFTSCEDKTKMTRYERETRSVQYPCSNFEKDNFFISTPLQDLFSDANMKIEAQKESPSKYDVFKSINNRFLYTLNPKYFPIKKEMDLLEEKEDNARMMKKGKKKKRTLRKDRRLDRILYQRTRRMKKRSGLILESTMNFPTPIKRRKEKKRKSKMRRGKRRKRRPRKK